MRQLDGKFSVDGDRIFKTSSGEDIPENEPIIIMRARDRLALPTLQHYRQLCIDDGATDYQIIRLDERIREFMRYAFNNPIKQPGITRGAAWDGTPS